ELRAHAVDRGGRLEHDLVGFQVDQVLVAGDAVADLLVPGGDGGVGDRLGENRDFDFSGHGGRPAKRLDGGGRWWASFCDVVAVDRIDERVGDEPGLLGQVLVHVSGRRRGRTGTTSV